MRPQVGPLSDEEIESWRRIAAGCAEMGIHGDGFILAPVARFIATIDELRQSLELWKDTVQHDMDI